MSPTFLTADELRELTGYTQWKSQIRWLVRAGVRHYVRKDGRPVVIRAHLEGSLVPSGSTGADEPDWDAITPTRGSRNAATA